MAVSKLLTVVRLVVLGIACMLLLLGHAIPGWYNSESVEGDNMTWRSDPYRRSEPYLSRRKGLWYADICINTTCSLYSIPLLGKSLVGLGPPWWTDFIMDWIPVQVVAVLVLVLCTSVMIRYFWEVRKTPSLSRHDLIAFFAILLAGVIGATIALDTALNQIIDAIKRERNEHFPFPLFLFALGSFLTIAVAVIHAIEFILRIKSSFYEDTARQPQGEHSPQNDIPRSLRYCLTASKVVLPIALVLLVLGIVTPRWIALQDEANNELQLGIWYCDWCRGIDFDDRGLIKPRVCTLIPTVLTLLSVVVVMVTTSRKQRHIHTACILVSFSLTLASASFSAWTTAISIESYADNKYWNDFTLVFPYSLFLFGFGTVLNLLIAIYQAVILFRVWPLITTHRDEDTVPIIDNNEFELPDVHEDIPETE